MSLLTFEQRDFFYIKTDFRRFSYQHNGMRVTPKFYDKIATNLMKFHKVYGRFVKFVAIFVKFVAIFFMFFVVFVKFVAFFIKFVAIFVMFLVVFVKFDVFFVEFFGIFFTNTRSSKSDV